MDGPATASVSASPRVPLVSPVPTFTLTDFLRDREGGLPRPRVDLDMPAAFWREREDDGRHVRERREGGAGTAEVDDGLLLVQRALLAGKVETREDDHACE